MAMLWADNGIEMQRSMVGLLSLKRRGHKDFEEDQRVVKDTRVIGLDVGDDDDEHHD